MASIKKLIWLGLLGLGACAPPPLQTSLPYPRGVFSDVIQTEVLETAIGGWNAAVGLEVYVAGEIPDGVNIYVGVDDLIPGRAGESYFDGPDCTVMLDVEYQTNITTLVHELGHCLGLRYETNPKSPAHNPDPASVMFFQVMDNEYGRTQTITEWDSSLARANLLEE